MMRRVKFAVLVMVVCSTVAWPKMKKEEQDYLQGQIDRVNAQIRALQDQMKGFNGQLKDLSDQMALLQKNQNNLIEDLHRLANEQHFLSDAVNSSSRNSDSNFTSLRETVSSLAHQLDTIQAMLGPRPPPPQNDGTTGGPIGSVDMTSKPTPPRPVDAPTPQTPDGKIVSVVGEQITISLGSGQGLKPGAALDLYKQNNTQVIAGKLQVTEVLSENFSRAKVVNMVVEGARAERDDVVRPEAGAPAQ